MISTRDFYCPIERTGEGDLAAFRDAVITYCAALKADRPFHFSGSEKAGELLRWMGVDFSTETGTEPPFGASLPKSGFPSTPLERYREQGYLGVTLMAALIRSSYGPEEEGYFPTQSELGFYFDEALLRGEPARWDQEYLDECQQFFFEELTPAELVEEVLEVLGPQAREAAEPFTVEIHGMAFLIGERTTNLLPLVDFFRELLLGPPLPELQRLLQSVPQWEQGALERVWRDGDLPETRKWLDPLPINPETILFACGPELLRWRAAR